MNKEFVTNWVSEMHDRKKASHLVSVGNAFSWLEKHPIIMSNGMDLVEIDGIQAAIIHRDFRFAPVVMRFQPVQANGDIGNGPGMILSLNF